MHQQDMVNRKLSMDILVEMACMQQEKQFIFLTPQALVYVSEPTCFPQCDHASITSTSD